MLNAGLKGCVFIGLFFIWRKRGVLERSILSRQKVSSGERFNTLGGKYAGKIQSGKNLSHLLPLESVTCVLPWDGSSFINIELSIGGHEMGYIKCPPLHPHPDSPDFIVAPGPSCIFLPSCKIQEMFVLWGEIECMEEICRPQYRYKFRSCSLYEGLEQTV